MANNSDDPKAYTFGEFLEEKFDVPVRIGCAEFIEKNLTIRLYGVGVTDDGFFEIDMDRGDLVFWLEHLNRKRWATSEMIGDFVRIWLLHKK